MEALRQQVDELREERDKAKAEVLDYKYKVKEAEASGDVLEDKMKLYRTE